MRSRVAAVLAVVVVLLPACGGGRLFRRGHDTERPSAGDDRRTLDLGGETRWYVLHVPESASKGRGTVPLVLMLHGGGGRADRIDEQTGWADLADREGFVVAFPQAVERRWNDGRADASSPSYEMDVDDVAFLSAVIDDVGTQVPLDRRRVYSAGISNGAFMSARLACALSRRVAAVATVAAKIAPELLGSCKPSRPVSVVSLNGTGDPVVPYEGGRIALGRTERGDTTGVAEATAFWARTDGCDPQPEVTDLADNDPDDGSTATRETYTDCRDATAVVLYRVEGGGHTWPGGRQYLSERVVGPVNRDVDATRVIWDFFAAHPAPR